MGQHSFQYLSQLANQKREVNADDQENVLQTFLCALVQGKKLHIPIGDVKEIIPKPLPVKIGHTKPWFEGIIKVQGDIYSAVNIGMFIHDTVVPEKNTFAIALSLPDGNYALLVNNVLGIIKVGEMDKSDESDFIDIYQTVDNQLIEVLPINKLIQSTEFIHASVF